MNTAKKSGRDLSALKARLAKKGGPESSGAQAPSPLSGGPLRGSPRVPAGGPGVGVPPPSAPVIPPPGQALPPPGQAVAPVEEQGFDPNAGLIEVAGAGDVPRQGNRGIIIVATLGALLFGGAVGWLVNSRIEASSLADKGKKKGQEMYEEVKAVADMQENIVKELKEIAPLLEKDAAQGGEALKQLSATNFEKHPKVDTLFGWQLAAIHPNGIKRVFELYKEANELKMDLSYLANFVITHADEINAPRGPQALGVVFEEKGGVTLVERLQAACKAENQEQPVPCPPDKQNEAIAYLVRRSINKDDSKDVKLYAIGTGPNQVMPIDNTGSVYSYLVEQNPENNTRKVYQQLLARVNERLDAMNQAQKRALTALKNFAENPTFDGSGQPDPDAGG